MKRPLLRTAFLLASLIPSVVPQDSEANPNVYVSRFWHNHQPLYWPEWNRNGGQTNRGQYAWDSIVLKSGQNYGGLSPKQHPENNLIEIFSKADRVKAYQEVPRDSLAGINANGGFAISYSASLIDNVRQLGAGGHLGYRSDWNAGFREARGWRTQGGAGSTRMDMLGFTAHHSLGPLLPKSVFRKEIQVFKQAWWKAWGGNSDLSDHSKGFFPTEMAYSRHLIDVLVDEGFEWTLVASHHISRTSPSYNDRANPAGNFNIKSSPPNKADQISPRFDNLDQWWFSEPNPGNAAWNVAPFAYQLHRVKYVNPENGEEKRMYAVPSDDVLSYRYGYANEGIGKIIGEIEPHANVPVIVIPATDGDNAWGGGNDSWFGATFQLFDESAKRGYRPSTPQDFVNAVKGSVTTDTHIEDGAWIFPEMCYGSPNFMKWIEPPVSTVANRGVTTVPGTQIDMETPGFALKFYSFAPLMAGANWVETAEQILRDEGGSVQAWKIQAPYDWDGTWTQPNDVELAWHIYLKGLDSGFNYYGGLGNDDEVKPGLATRRAIERLQPWMTSARRNNDRTPPTVLKPQRFPYNPGGFTFGWFNQQPHIPNIDFLKRMNSEFYIWTHAYDLSGIPDGNVKVKIRIDNDGINPIDSNQNETYAGGGQVGAWVTLNMSKRVLPKTREELNAAAAAPGEIDFFLPSNEQADYYFVKITDTNLPNFRNKLLDYYIEATDAKGNVHKSEIQHVWVDDFSGQTNGGGGGGGGGGTGGPVTLSPTNPVAGQPLTVVYNPAGRVLASANAVNIHHGFNQNVAANWTALPGLPMTRTNGTNWAFTYTVPANATTIALVFNNGSSTWDNNGGGNWNFSVASQPPPTNPPAAPTGLQATATTSASVSLAWTAPATAISYVVFRNGNQIGTTTDPNYVDSGLSPETPYTYAVRAVNVAGQSVPSATLNVATSFAPLNPDRITIVDPAVATGSPGSSFLFRGRAGSAFTNGLIWSNPLTGSSGIISFVGGNVVNGWEWTALVPLGAGTNMVAFRGDYATSSTQTLNDSPANYSAWSNGLTGGTGFGAWSLTSSGSGGHFLANNPANLNVGSATGFGLWANNGGTSTATRNFNSPMAAGDRFALRFDNNWVESGGEVGFALTDNSGNIRFRFYFANGFGNYRITDSATARDTGIAYTEAGLNLAFTLDSASNYTLSTGVTNVTGTLAATGGPISRLVVENKNAGSNTERNFYIGSMTHTRRVADSGTVNTPAPAVTFGTGQTDGLPDAWWAQYGITGSDRVAASDPDGDRFTNAQEHALGTDPTDSRSLMEITSVTRAGSVTTIEWSSVPDKKYRLHASPTLAPGDWQPVGSEKTATSNRTTETHNSNADAHYYRVHLVP